MDREKPPFPDALRRLADEERRKLGDHPAVETLVAYHEGRLPAAEQERVADHLALCEHCRGLLLDLGGFADLGPPAGTEPLTPRDVEASWQSLRSRLKEESPAEAKPVRAPEAEPQVREVEAVQEPRRSVGWSSPRRAYLALAASLVLTVFSVTWVAVHSQRRERLDGPLLNVPIVQVVSEQERTRGGEDVARVPAGEGSFVLSIIPPEPGTFQEYGIEVQGSAEPRLPERLEDRGDGSGLTLLLPRDQFPPGRYTLRLFGVEDGRRGQELATYSFEVEG